MCYPPAATASLLSCAVYNKLEWNRKAASHLRPTSNHPPSYGRCWGGELRAALYTLSHALSPETAGIEILFARHVASSIMQDTRVSCLLALPIPEAPAYCAAMPSFPQQTVPCLPSAFMQRQPGRESAAPAVQQECQQERRQQLPPTEQRSS